MVKRMDLSITQDVFHNIAGKRNAGQFRIDFTNFGNLLNHNWGVSQRLVVPTHAGQRGADSDERWRRCAGTRELPTWPRPTASWWPSTFQPQHEPRPTSTSSCSASATRSTERVGRVASRCPTRAPASCLSLAGSSWSPRLLYPPPAARGGPLRPASASTGPAKTARSMTEAYGEGLSHRVNSPRLPLR